MKLIYINAIINKIQCICFGLHIISIIVIIIIIIVVVVVVGCYMVSVGDQ